MKTQVEEISQAKKKLLIEVEAEEIDNRIAKAYRNIGKKAKIKGFRPGKIPLKILERYYEDQVLSDVTGSVIQETLFAAFEETKIYPLGAPVVENGSLKRGEAYKYSAIFEVKPEFELRDYLGIEIEKEECLITNEDVENQIKEIRESHGNLKSIEEDRGIRDGDYVIIDYEGFDQDSPVRELKAENFPVRIGEERFYPGIEKALLGAKKDENREITVDFKDNYFNTRLAGKSIKFQVRVTDIKEIELPELTDEFIKGLGGEFETQEQLREKIREILKEREEKRIDRDLKERLVEIVADSVDFELPEILIQEEINAAFENVKQNLRRAGASIENSGLDETKMKEEIKPSAQKNVKKAIILGEIAKLNDIAVSEEEIEEGFQKMAEEFNADADTVRRYYDANNMTGAFRHSLLKEKTLNYLLENAKVVEINSSKKRDE
jgi:trigger factor